MIWLVKFYLFNTINKEKEGDRANIKHGKFLFIYQKIMYNYAAMLFAIHSSDFFNLYLCFVQIKINIMWWQLGQVVCVGSYLRVYLISAWCVKIIKSSCVELVFIFLAFPNDRVIQKFVSFFRSRVLFYFGFVL